jgi:hypothetical protein
VAVDLAIKLPLSGALNVDYIGIGEKKMRPTKKWEKAEGGRAMILFWELAGTWRRLQVEPLMFCCWVV